ncbi:aminoacyl-tRNA hydrolase [Sporolactobacillus spathodeae]|nr:aminoacyl-tRNA hydrolase [Sporolactobacillus spathodeae]
MIAGLGNPGREYAGTRHNIGFDVIDRLANKYGIEINKSKFNGLFGKGTVNGEPVILVKPLTYMNLSGEAVAPLLRFFQIESSDLLIIQDDMDLPVGRIRIRAKGSSGGHNGLKSLIRHLHSEEFARIKVGIGHPPRDQQAVISHVLHGFTREEQPAIDDALDRAASAAVDWLVEPFVKVMNTYNANK